MQAHAAPQVPPIATGASAHISINASRLGKERFELTEVVEQTGSPYSARRRVKTAFHPDSPMKRDAI